MKKELILSIGVLVIIILMGAMLVSMGNEISHDVIQADEIVEFGITEFVMFFIVGAICIMAIMSFKRKEDEVKP